MSNAVIMYDRNVSRWSPDARGRLEKAAYELFLERGYDEATVADIAERAGLTERTFFRHFTDKREVLFSGSSALEHELLRALDETPPDAPPIEAARIAVAAISRLLRERAHARKRQTIVDDHPDLQERGLIKRATLTGTLARGLQQRGVPETAANLAADMGIAAFYVGFEQWLDDARGRELVEIVEEKFDELKAIASGVPL